ncbi:MAG: RimK family alpha-L-glutamate ligase [Clostridia bacterium]|nr:RimK family alpha-L-glutamate ligase [Clostridia bacterium]
MSFYIVYNGFWNPAAPPESAAALVAAATARGVELIPTPNTAWIASFDCGGTAVQGANGPLTQADTVLFWDKDTRLAHAMEETGARLFNRAESIEWCDDKLKTHWILAKAGLPQPKTLAAPMTYIRTDTPGCGEFWRQAEETLGFPLVVKECFGSLGGQVYLAPDAATLRRLTAEMGAKPFLVQQFIAETAGNDKRLYVVGGRVAAAMERHSDSDFRANIENGGSGTAYTPTPAEEALALRACRALHLDFGGVDLLDSPDGSLICEVNSNAHMAGITACTGVDVAAAIIDYILETRLLK